VKTLWSELEFAGRALMMLLALILVATPIGVGLLVRRTHAAGLDSPLDWVRAGHREAWAEETRVAAEALDTFWAAPTLVKAAPLATMVGGAGAIKRGTPTQRPSVAQPTAAAAVTATPDSAAAPTASSGNATSGGLKRPGVRPTPTETTPVPPMGTLAALGTTTSETPSALLDTLVAHYVELPDGGIATLIQAPELAILVDAGGSLETGPLLEYILSLGIDHLDMLIITRYDEAHTAELPGLIPLLAPDILWTPNESAVDDAEQLLFELEDSVGGDHYTPKAGESYWYDDLLIECLYSLRIDSGASSLAIRLTYGEMAMLFAGDPEAERALTYSANTIHAEALRLAPDVAGAQGLDAETAAVLLDSVRPEFVVHSGGAAAAPLLESIRSSDVPVYALADYGTLTFVTDGWVYQLEAGRIP
jgi:beta-lactamase superfamily II metal-dependent hydrolase